MPQMIQAMRRNPDSQYRHPMRPPDAASRLVNDWFTVEAAGAVPTLDDLEARQLGACYDHLALFDLSVDSGSFTVHESGRHLRAFLAEGAPVSDRRSMACRDDDAPVVHLLSTCLNRARPVMVQQDRRLPDGRTIPVTRTALPLSGNGKDVSRILMIETPMAGLTETSPKAPVRGLLAAAY